MGKPDFSDDFRRDTVHQITVRGCSPHCVQSRGAPYHPQAQGKTERWHQTLKNRILLENYFLRGDLEAQNEAFVDNYNHHRHHESRNNVTPADLYFGREKAILQHRERTKRKTLVARRLHHRRRAAQSNQPDERDTLLVQVTFKTKNSADGQFLTSISIF